MEFLLFRGQRYAPHSFPARASRFPFRGKDVEVALLLLMTGWLRKESAPGKSSAVAVK